MTLNTKPMLKITTAFILFIISMGSGAASIEAKNCPVTDGKAMNEGALKLKLAEQGYRVIDVTFDESSHCFHLYGFNPQRLRVLARFNPYSGEFVYEETTKKLDIK